MKLIPLVKRTYYSTTSSKSKSERGFHLWFIKADLGLRKYSIRIAWYDAIRVEP